MYFVSFCSRFIDRFALCVLFRRAMWAHQFHIVKLQDVIMPSPQENEIISKNEKFGKELLADLRMRSTFTFRFCCA